MIYMFFSKFPIVDQYQPITPISCIVCVLLSILNHRINKHAPTGYIHVNLYSIALILTILYNMNYYSIDMS